jgi:Domain of unknown function (DUF4276)
MSRLRIVPIVEGHGEVDAVPKLLRRICKEFFGEVFVNVLQPIRGKRDRLVTDGFDDLCRSISLAAGKLRAADRDHCPGLVLVLVDAEDELACQLGPTLLKRARECRSDIDITCVVANRCYETWFAAAAGSLSNELDLTNDSELPNDPESQNLRKGWVAKRIRRATYSETVDQARLTAAMDLRLCRANSPSFDKLCRELESRLHNQVAH